MRKDKHTMAGNPVTLAGEALVVGEKAPEISVLTQDLAPFTLNDMGNGVKLISVVPSLDTPVCELQASRFNEEAASLDGAKVFTVSMDLPFALGRFCSTNGIENLTSLSDHKDADLGQKWGFLINELRLLNRGVVILDADNVVRYVEYVEENTNHPDYDAALAAAKELL